MKAEWDFIVKWVSVPSSVNSPWRDGSSGRGEGGWEERREVTYVGRWGGREGRRESGREGGQAREWEGGRN